MGLCCAEIPSTCFLIGKCILGILALHYLWGPSLSELYAGNVYSDCHTQDWALGSEEEECSNHNSYPASDPSCSLLITARHRFLQLLDTSETTNHRCYSIAARKGQISAARIIHHHEEILDLWLSPKGGEPNFSNRKTSSVSCFCQVPKILIQDLRQQHPTTVENYTLSFWLPRYNNKC